MTTLQNRRDRLALHLHQLGCILLLIAGAISVGLGDLAKAIASTSTGAMRFDVVGDYPRYIGLALLAAGAVRWIRGGLRQNSRKEIH